MNYIPVSNGSLAGTFGGILKLSPINNHWWEKESFFQYPSMLCSSFYAMKDKNYRERFNIPEKFILFGDSGGFQNLSSDRNLNWKTVLDWQKNNCDVIFSLDYPIAIYDSPNERDIKNKKTIENIKLMINNRDDKKYYGCLHGLNKSEVIKNYNEIKNLDLDGIAHGEFAQKGIKKSSKIDKIVLNFATSDLPHHFLGLSSSIGIAVLYFISKIKNQHFYYDNSSYGVGAMVRKYNIDEKKSIILNKNSKIKSLGCDCPVCTQSKLEDMKNDGSTAGALISLHNLYQEIKKDSWIKSLIESPDELFDYLQLSKSPKNIQDRIKYLFEYEDLEKYMKKFPYKAALESNQTIF